MKSVCHYKSVSVMVISLCLLLACLFSFVGSMACTTIIYEQDIEKVEMLQQVFNNANYYTYNTEGDLYTVYDTDKTQLGYAFIVVAEGYEDRIDILVGLNDAETLKGISILYTRECFGENGLRGPVINFDDFNTQFNGLKIEECYTKLRGGVVDGITRATISTNVITDSVREASLEKVKLIG